jgi:hypothetical protein
MSLSTANLPGTEPQSQWYRYSSSDLAVVFVHGLHSNKRDCWLSDSPHQYWPHLVARDERFRDAAIFLGSYYTAADAAHLDVDQCATQLYDAMRLPDATHTQAVLDKMHLVFVCHSMGGIVLRRLLVAHHASFENKRVALLLVASPARGSSLARLARPLARLFRHSQLAALEPNSRFLTELERDFARLVADRTIATFFGKELCEHRRTPLMRWQQWLAHPLFAPLRGLTIVQRDSAGGCFGTPIVVPTTDHITIAKPTSLTHPSHRHLFNFLVDAKFVTGTPPDFALPDSSQWQSPAHLIDTLERRFGMRYEPAQLTKPFRVYWPVRLRQPTVIHACQAFVAAGLQKSGGVLELWIDDLGNITHPPGDFEGRIKNWITAAGGDASALAVYRLSSEPNPCAADRWAAVTAWLGKSHFKLSRILTVSKLLTSEEAETQHFQDLLEKRPRRLLSPALVWAGLSSCQTAASEESVVTLGGSDEAPMWSAWRECVGQGAKPVSHLYVPGLLYSNSKGDRYVHMADDSLSWHSRDDIAGALRSEFASTTERDPLAEGRLIPWLLSECILLHAFMAGDQPLFQLHGRIITSVSQLDGIEREAIIPAMADALTRILLQ